LRRREHDPVVVAWFERQRTADLFLSVISIGEIERGIARQTRILRARLRLGWIGC
jgi:predicted nucleic acid-binding protein